ncbi:hypothetical protein P5V15_003242 [Pogonomyrmex californicus]
MYPSALRHALRHTSEKLTVMRRLHLHASRFQRHTSPLTQFTDDELMTKEMVAKLAKQEIAPLVRKMEREGRIDNHVFRKLFGNGLMGIEIPTEYSGMRSNFLTTILTIEEIAKVDAAMATPFDIQNMINLIIFKIGFEEQEQKYLLKLAQISDFVGSFCLTEPDSGSDAFSLKTEERKDGAEYVINGTKMWMSNSDVAQVFVLFANAIPPPVTTTFLVDRDTPGLMVGKLEDKMGIEASGTCMVHFDNVRIPEDNLLGKFGHGYKYAIGFLNKGRIGIGAQMIDIAQELDATIPHVGEKIIWERCVLLSKSATSDSSSGSGIGVRQVTRLQRREIGRGQKGRLMKKAAMAKFFASEIACRITAKCIDFVGGVGFTTDFSQEKYFRDAKIDTIYDKQYAVIDNCKMHSQPIFLNDNKYDIIFLR